MEYKTVEQQIRERLESLLKDVQSGELGKPTLSALYLCGMVHAVLENSINGDCTKH
jgi:hypothetical protein